MRQRIRTAMRTKEAMAPLKMEDLMNGGNKRVADSMAAGVDVRESKKLVRYLRSLDLRRADFDYLKQTLIPLRMAISSDRRRPT